jgi:uncharacterized RDD family membrane protein YckC
MDLLTAFGLFAVTAMLVCYALEDRGAWYSLAFAGACALGSLYGFLQGAWPFGLIEAIWAGVAINRWRLRVRHLRAKTPHRLRASKCITVIQPQRDSLSSSATPLILP